MNKAEKEHISNLAIIRKSIKEAKSLECFATQLEVICVGIMLDINVKPLKRVVKQFRQEAADRRNAVANLRGRL